MVELSDLISQSQRDQAAVVEDLFSAEDLEHIQSCVFGDTAENSELMQEL